MYTMFLPTHSKISLFVVCLGSLLFLIDGLKAGNSAGNRERRLLASTGLAGLLFVALELSWYFYVGLLESREVTLAYYFVWRLWGGIVAGMCLYLVYRKAKVSLAALAVLLVTFNAFVIVRHFATMSCIGIGDGLLGGMFVASLVLLWFDQPQDRDFNTDSTIQPLPTTAEKNPSC